MTKKEKIFLNTYESGKYSGAIGVFDSGIGGLTVLKSLIGHFPNESFLYLGDTARLPYGTKSPETVIKYSESMTRVLINKGVKAVVVACNTASSHAIGAVTKMAGNIPVIGMIEPTAQAAVKFTKNNHIGVIATAGTIRSKIYETTIHAINSDIKVSVVPAQVLVALAEEGWVDDNVARMTINKYLTSMFDVSNPPDTLILGCTHFPLFAPLLRDILGAGVTLINSGDAASIALKNVLSDINNTSINHSVKFLATDDPNRFASGAARFFDHPISVSDVTLIDVTG